MFATTTSAREGVPHAVIAMLRYTVYTVLRGGRRRVDGEWSGARGVFAIETATITAGARTLNYEEAFTSDLIYSLIIV